MKKNYVITLLLLLSISGNVFAQDASTVNFRCHPVDFAKYKPEAFVEQCVTEYNASILLATNKQKRYETGNNLDVDVYYMTAAIKAGLGGMAQMRIDRRGSSSACGLLGKSLKAKNMINNSHWLRYLNDPELSNISMAAIEKMHTGQCKKHGN